MNGEQRTDAEAWSASIGRPAYARLRSVLECILDVEEPSKFRWSLDDTGFFFRFRSVSQGWSAWTAAKDVFAWNLAADDASGTAERLASRDLYPMEWIRTERWAAIRPCLLHTTQAEREAGCARCNHKGRYLDRHELPFGLLWRFASEPEVVATVEALALEMGRCLFEYEPRIAWRTGQVSDLGNVGTRERIDVRISARASRALSAQEEWIKAFAEDPTLGGELPRGTAPWHQPLQEILWRGYQYGGMHDDSTMILIAP